ncbi:MAG: pyrroline-5-carboxylate reductase [Actinomycetota bacterium]|jgi:pyrroline-5-carboxylate reductase|nr:pyrroline-5-carboxylate reductase [Actinomycetota bacterium]
MSAGNFRLDGRVAFIGGGRMGEAIVAGLIAAKTVLPDQIVVSEPVAERRVELASSYGVTCVTDGHEAIEGADVVVLAVKPQIMDAVVATLSDGLAEALVISIAAGVTCARLESALPAGTAVVRVMPNAPAMVGQGMAVVSGGAEASAEQVSLVSELFSLLGHAIIIEEHHQDAATAISGSGPAYVALFVDALARAGVRQGLSRRVAEDLAVQTIRGTADLIEQTGQHPEQVIDAVSSPGGTTIAAIEALEAGGLRASVASAVDAAVRRSKELGS